MGQGFADEIFRVFQNRHPDIVLTVNNANEEVAGMIQHVKSNGKPLVFVIPAADILDEMCAL